MTDLSSIITQVNRGDTLPTVPPAPKPVAPAAPTRKGRTAFGGCCGGKRPRAQRSAASARLQETHVMTGNAQQLQSVIAISTQIENSMLREEQLARPSVPDSGAPIEIRTRMESTAELTMHVPLPETAGKGGNYETEEGFSVRVARKEQSTELTPPGTDGTAHAVPPPDKEVVEALQPDSEPSSGLPSPELAVEVVPREQKPMYFTKQPDWKPAPGALLPPPLEQHYYKKLLVLDLDETLVHSSFNKVDNADMVINISIDDPATRATVTHSVYVYKRPFVDEFLETMSRHYELAIFTASLKVYCDAVMEQLDPQGICTHRLYRNSCVQSNGVFVKDMTLLGRPLESVIILDNCAASYMFQPENGILAIPFYDDRSDTFLKDIEDTMVRLSRVEDVRVYLRNCS